MRKSNLFCFVLASTFLFVSCKKHFYVRYIPSSEEYCENLSEKVYNSIVENNIDDLSSLFSSEAVEQSTSLNEKFDMLRDFIKGDITTYEVDDFIATSTTSSDGNTIKMVRFGFDLITTNNRYNIFIIAYSENYEEPEKKGIYMLEIADINYNEYVSWQERMKPGIVILESSKDE